MHRLGISYTYNQEVYHNHIVYSNGDHSKPFILSWLSPSLDHQCRFDPAKGIEHIRLGDWEPSRRSIECYDLYTLVVDFQVWIPGR